ncbi:MAG: Gfo/Idh/MocA family oxidoreductase, partial [bacterium]|nr:Gfo/Idh/MocA family oxidoreductase [bacterium]
LRYFDIVDEAKEIISKEQVAFARGRYYGGVPGEGRNKWLITKAMSGGQLVEQATHIVNLMQYFCGDVEEVYGYKIGGINNKIYQGYDVEDASSILMKFKNGYIGNLTCTWLWNGFNSGVEVVGKGIILDYQGNTLTVDKGNKKTTSISSIDPMFEEEKAFIKAVETGKSFYVKSDYIDGLKTLAITLKAHESMEKGIPVKI